MSTSDRNKKHESGNIWSRMTLDQFVTAVASLGDRVKKLRSESWRVKDHTGESNSVWNFLINQLGLDRNEKTRHALYNLLYRKRDKLRNRIKEELIEKGVDINEVYSDTSTESATISIEENGGLHLQPVISAPLPEPECPNTRSYRNKQISNDDINNDNNSLQEYEAAFILTPHEWHKIFSYTNNGLRDEWTNTVADKLKDECGVTCALVGFRYHFKGGSRKQTSNYLRINAHCKNSECERRVKVTLREYAEQGTSPMFRVAITGRVKHDCDKKMWRHLTGEERRRVGKNVLCCLYYRITSLFLVYFRRTSEPDWSYCSFQRTSIGC